MAMVWRIASSDTKVESEEWLRDTVRNREEPLIGT